MNKDKVLDTVTDVKMALNDLEMRAIKEGCSVRDIRSFCSGALSMLNEIAAAVGALSEPISTEPEQAGYLATAVRREAEFGRARD